MKNKQLKKFSLVGLMMALLVSVLVACTDEPKNETKQETQQENAQQPIIIQGPMPIEAEKFADMLENVKEEKSGDFVFYIGTLD